MAAHTGGQFGDPDTFVGVFYDHLALVVASGTGVVGERRGMAGSARDLAFVTVVEREDMLAELCGAPGGGGMAGGAVFAKQTGMNGRLFVAGRALARSAGKTLTDVTGRALNLGVCPRQGEDAAVIEVGHPIDAIVAGETVAAELATVLIHPAGILISVAGGAQELARREGVPGMTTGTCQRRPGEVGLVARQTEEKLMVKQGFIEAGRAPTGRLVARGAVRTKLTGMEVRFVVAGNAR